ncbi:hypothetical protein O7599_24040 [Streptomyces sp. WMMC500]|uniref:hypothetical protein n=1 Tax=Streptomyces sp. WMMC500 TaxID=3015154 RepID=UPI00248BBE65|nr:hypothetical protein [Streptomyces sp. WMMC500]WBB58681.1 hypothetical protein O7599_24040 [Streptomyces sp. WMMC500]
MRVRRHRLRMLASGTGCALASCVFLLPGTAVAQTSGGGIGSASSAAGRYVDPGMNAGSTMGATVGTGTFSGGFSAGTGSTTTSGGSGTTDGDGDVGWGRPLLLVGALVLVYALGGHVLRLVGAAAGAVRRGGRVRGR